VALRGVLTRVAEPDAVLRVVLQQAVDLTGATRGVFVEVSPGGELAFSVLHAYRADALHDSGHYSRAVFARCLESGEDLLLANAVEDMPVAGKETVRLYRMAAVLCMPIRAGGRIAALVHLEHARPGAFDDSHRSMLRPLIELAGPVLEALAAGRDVLQERDRLAESERRLREEAEESRSLLAQQWSFGRFVGRSPPVRELESRLRRAAATSWPVLLLGETGTGKGILARILHSASARATRPFVTVFCPSLDAALVESELFGHRRGAFTGAVQDRAGKVQAAESGTLFLDEIGDLPLGMQPRLLRLLQERTYERVGDPAERVADVRVVAATSRDLESEVRAGSFRRDLFERLNYLPVRVPPLRERRGDIPRILRHALDRSEEGRWIEVDPGAERWLVDLDFAWPGNVRHLEQLAARIVLESPGRPVTAADLRRLLGTGEAESGPEAAADPGAGGRSAAAGGRAPAPATALAGSPDVDLDAGLPTLLKESERGWLDEALRRHPDITRAELAARLKISEAALYKKLRQYGLGG
jgi:transcriptional regulator with GAF, ATPase, and Fis domain